MKDIVPVILAAGESRRMGYPKALLPLGDGTFLSRIVESLERIGLPEPYLVLGGQASHIRQAVAGWKLRIIVNEDYRLGQLSSMKRALEHLPSDVRACLVWPVDQPLVSPELVSALVRLYLDTDAALVLPAFEGKRGHPAIFASLLFAEILESPEQEGAKRIVLRHESEIRVLQTEEQGIILDIDTPEDYYRITGETLVAALARRQAANRPWDG